MSSSRRINLVPRLLLLMVLIAVGSLSGAAYTVVIDAGHGGHDHGALGAKICEKDINLAVATRVGRLISENMKDAKVVYTRDKDVFIPLQGRCDIANKARGDIFVSIHTNSVDAKSPRRKTVCGAQVYTLGLSRTGTNLDVAMRENSVMKLEDDYTETYSGFDPSSAESYIIFELSQSSHIDQSLRLAKEIQSELATTAGRVDQGVRQAPFWVLVRTSMPAVLVELDFVCNPQVEEFLGSDSGRDKLAAAIYNGIAAYRGKSKVKEMPSKAPSQPKGKKSGKKKQEPAKVEAATAADDAVIYKVQFLTSARRLADSDKRLSGIEGVDCYLDGGVVKYTAGAESTLEGAQKILTGLRKRYPDAFVIKTRGGKRIR